VARRQTGMPGLFPDERIDALSIGDLLDQVNRAIADAFPRGPGVWVRGEIQSIQDHRSGHCYIDLVDPDGPRGRDRPVLKVNCWRTTWGPLRAVLSGQGITLQQGMVVTLRGRVEFYAPRAQVNFIASEIDVSALLGRLAAQRAALLKALEEEGLLRRNAMLATPPVPLRIGLVASPRTEGYNDFLGQLQGSAVAFSVTLLPVQVQGSRAPFTIAGALDAMAERDVDVTVLVRGGGAKSDLVAFDSEPVARAIARHPRPVWTGIGHTGDQSVADIVAARSFVTPTECGQELVRQVTAWWEAVLAAGRLIARRAGDVVARATERDAAARHRLSHAARHQLHRHGERLVARTATIATRARTQVDLSAESLSRRAGRVAPGAVTALERAEQRALTWRRLLAAYDVERQLERGYTITFDADGKVVRTAAALQDGQQLVTRFADGSARSVVTGTEANPPQEDT